MLKGLKKFVSFTDQAFFGFSSILLVTLTVTAVIFRFLLNNPIQWTEEVQMILVVWCVFFGGSIAIREKGEIAVDIFFDAMPKGLKKVCGVVIWILVAIAIAGITKLQLDRVRDLLAADLRTSVLKIPSALEYIVVVFACCLMFLSHLIEGAENLGKVMDKEAPNE